MVEPIAVLIHKLSSSRTDIVIDFNRSIRDVVSVEYYASEWTLRTSGVAAKDRQQY